MARGPRTRTAGFQARMAPLKTTSATATVQRYGTLDAALVYIKAMHLAIRLL